MYYSQCPSCSSDLWMAHHKIPKSLSGPIGTWRSITRDAVCDCFHSRCWTYLLWLNITRLNFPACSMPTCNRSGLYIPRTRIGFHLWVSIDRDIDQWAHQVHNVIQNTVMQTVGARVYKGGWWWRASCACKCGSHSSSVSAAAEGRGALHHW
jgi:hypothetical protein